LSSPVVFLDVREGAGFENSFGWYNVGDDVQTAAGRDANLHPVMGCGVPMNSGAGDATHHSGNPSYYFQNAEEPNTISVDFNSEKTAGRYKGGFIGFYLITPEGHASNNGCGDFKNGSDGKSLFGFIYFTQKDLNNDGDFVHHLVYTSKNTADRFYFGFEDLFRGGDNDFEDMAMRIDGLTPPCVPTAETCDGLDNDCDGLVDAADPDLSGVGTACTCDGVGLTCDNGPRAGVCQVGVTTCSAGAIVCHGTGTPSAEVCDGLDNNCNNQTDENIPVGAACDGPDADLCPEGNMVCQNGQTVCSDNTPNNIETCNNFDDNCNGQTDEGNPGGGASCGSSIGACSPGTTVCQNGGLVCTGGMGPTPETCNGVDDDCNGVVDNSPTDVGMQCGATDTGECEFGQTICIGGSLQCGGQIGPTVETCNNRDDNCNGTTDDNPVDAGQPCGSSVGVCTPGVYVCTNGGLVCQGGTGPTMEVCDGLDNDCNGIIDDNVPGEGEACGGMASCQNGLTKCISGSIQCVGGQTSGTEVCNGVDDDCDGNIDEGPLCSGGVCDNGTCAAPCVNSEFPCPIGKKCNPQNFCVDDPCYGVTCPADGDGNAQACDEGVCQPICNTTTCTGNTVCRPSDGSCVPDTCEYLPKCQANELCINGTCQSDPCMDVTCPADQFCRQGACIKSCNGISCDDGQTCVDGACVATGCKHNCAPQVCHADTGQCVDDPCSFVLCPMSQACDPTSGQCVADPCQGVTCPGDQTCHFGQCGVAHPNGTHVTVGGGGCDAGGGSGSWLVALGALLFVVRRRRQKVGPFALAAMMSVTGCRLNDYCIDCVTDDGGMGSGSGSGSGSNGSGSNGVTCDPTQGHPEQCNGADDDCDGAIDETFDLQSDRNNCGTCGNVCNKNGAQTTCNAGACEITACFPGFSDVNGDTTGPYAQSDGCEYQCFNSNNGVEACDGVDNNCNGTTDEGFATQADVNNCGACNHVCEFFKATPHCTASMCEFDPQTDCNAGYHDIDGMQANGCEYQCNNTNNGVEACDLVDNNCNGAVDEGFNFTNDVNNCSRCGFVCTFPHATPSCTLSVCMFNPTTDCEAGFVDANGKQLDGCEYQCSQTNGGIEICDGKDNDCNGVADDNTIDEGGSCAATGVPQGACIANGVLTCSNGQLSCQGATEPTAETCNNSDDNCDGTPDNGVTQSCYSGSAGTNGVGACHGGTSTCAAGVFGSCVGEVTPTSEQCNGIDDNCNGAVDDGPGNTVITQSCYTGATGTDGHGTCTTGTKTCAFGAFGPCQGQVVPKADVCGDGLDTDCDDQLDAAEGCLVQDSEQRLDAPGGSLGTNPGARHSYDVVLARGNGSNVYAAWSELVGSTTEVYFRKSTDGGQTWGTIINVTSSVSATAVKPQLAVAPGATDVIVVVYQTVASGVRDIIVQRSTDGGATFGAAGSALDASGDSFHHVVAISGTTCVVAWEKLNTSTLNRDIQSRTSTDQCATFNGEKKINQSTGTRFAGRPQVGITSDGGIVWAWREQRSGATRDIFVAAAADAATAPTTDKKVDNDMTDKRDSDFPVLAVVGSAAYLVWQDVSTQTGGGADVMFTSSADGGATWTAEAIIDDPNAEVSSSFTPSLAVDAGGTGAADDLVAIAWEDRRNGTQVYTAVSLNGGTSFGAPVRASNSAGSSITGKTTVPMIAAAGSGVLVVTYQNQLTNQKAHVFVASSIDNGGTWTYTHAQLDTGSGDALTPQIVATVVSSKPGAVMAWTDFRTNGTSGDIYAAGSH
jgi:hypothetical protein